MDYNKRPDNNENDLVEFLREQGFSVERLYYVGRGVPDLVVGGPMPCPHCGEAFWQERLIEIKQEGRKLRPNQEKWWRRWNGGQATIARDRKDISAIVGLYRATNVRRADEGRRKETESQV